MQTKGTLLPSYPYFLHEEAQQDRILLKRD